jgi:cobalt/nickel transport system permease protein
VSGMHAMGVAGDPASRVHRLDPRAKIAGLAGITVVGVSTPPRHWPVLAVCAVALAVVAATARVGPGVLWSRAKVVLPLVLFVAVFVPFVDHGGATVSLGPLTLSQAGLAVLATVAAKATIGTMSAVLLGATTSYPSVLRALEALRVPRALTLIAAFTYRYLFVIAEETGRMRAALAARGYRPRSALGASALGRLISALFLRTHARGERVYLAMASRGFTGAMPQLEPLALRRADIAFLTLVTGALVALRIVVEVVR